MEPKKDPADLLEQIILRMKQEPALAAAIDGMSVEAYDLIEDDIYDLIEEWDGSD